MVWDRLKRVSDAELTSHADGTTAVIKLDRAPPPGWSSRFAASHAGSGAGWQGAGLELTARLEGAPVEAAVAEVDAQLVRANLLYEQEVLSPIVLEILEELAARDPSDLTVRAANTAGENRDREEADRAEYAFSNGPALLVEHAAKGVSRAVEPALGDQLVKAGCNDRRG